MARTRRNHKDVLNDDSDDESLCKSSCSDDSDDDGPVRRINTRASVKKANVQKKSKNKKKKVKKLGRKKSLPIPINVGVAATSIPKVYKAPDMDNVIVEDFTASTTVRCKCKKYFTGLTISHHLRNFCSISHSAEFVAKRRQCGIDARLKYRNSALGKIQIFKTNHLKPFLKNNPEPSQTLGTVGQAPERRISKGRSFGNYRKISIYIPNKKYSCFLNF